MEGNKGRSGDAVTPVNVEYELDRAQEDAFLDALYCCGMDARAAAKKLKWPMSQAEWAMKQPRTLQRIAELRRRIEYNLDATQERVLNELAGIAFLDPADIYNEDYELKPLDEIPITARRAIQSIQKTEGMKGGVTYKTSFFDKMAAIRMLGLQLGMFKETQKIEGKVEMSLPELLKSLGDRSAVPQLSDDLVPNVLPSLPLAPDDGGDLI